MKLPLVFLLLMFGASFSSFAGVVVPDCFETKTYEKGVFHLFFNPSKTNITDQKAAYELIANSKLISLHTQDTKDGELVLRLVSDFSQISQTMSYFDFKMSVFDTLQDVLELSPAFSIWCEKR